MRFLLILILGVYLFIKIVPPIPVCNLATAAQAIPPRIFAEQTVDGSRQNVILTRFLHNKIGIFTSEFGNCYLGLFDPNFVVGVLGFGFIFWVYFFYKILEKRNILFTFGVLAFPILPFLNIFPFLVGFAYKLSAIIGLFVFLKKVK